MVCATCRVYSTMLCYVQLCTVYRALQYSSSVSFCSSCGSLWKQHGVLETQPRFWWFLKTQPHTYMYTFVHICKFIYVHIHIHEYRIQTYKYIHIRTYTCIRICMWKLLRSCRDSICFWECVCVCVCHLCCTVVCGSSFSTGLAWARTLANTSSTYDTQTHAHMHYMLQIQYISYTPFLYIYFPSQSYLTLH